MKDNVAQNHAILISKVYIWKSRKNKFQSNTCLLKEISKIKNIEKKVSSVNEKKTLHIKESGKKLKTNYLKEVTTRYLNTNKILK